MDKLSKVVDWMIDVQEHTAWNGALLWTYGPSFAFLGLMAFFYA
jgi:hypothetical protein